MDRKTFVSRMVKDKHNSYMEYSLNENLSNAYFFDIYTFAEVKELYDRGAKIRHSHNFYNIAYVLDGQDEFKMKGLKYDIKPHRVFFLRPGIVYDRCHLDALDGIMISFSESFLSLMSNRFSIHIKFDVFFRPFGCAYCDVPQIGSELMEAIIKMKNEMTNCQQYGHKEIEALLLCQLIIYTERYGNWNHNVRYDINRVSYKIYADFLSLVDNFYAQEKNVKWYADRLNVSVMTLSKYVDEYNSGLEDKVTPLKIINYRRMEEAKRLLIGTNDNINVISEKLGFDECSNFVKFFKRMDYDGRTPVAYRKVMKSAISAR